MAYPFAQMPTLAEFESVLTSKFGVEVRKTQKNLKKDGEDRPARYFSREVMGELKAVTVPVVEPNERLTPHIIRTVCDRLKVPTSQFGLTLEDQGFDFAPPSNG